ncbi:MAG: PEP-CTERM sorting domain-containing protein [Bryobacteraceae bacterium]
MNLVRLNLAAIALAGSTLFAGVLEPGSQVCVDITATEQDVQNEGPLTSTQQFCTDVLEDGSFEFSQSEFSLGSDFINQLFFGGQADPFLSYGIAVADFGAPTTFGFSFSIPIAGGPYNTATHTMSASLTAGPDGSVSIGPAGGASDIAFASVDATNLGIDLGGAGCTGGPGSSVCGPFTESIMFGPSSPATATVEVNFLGSGGGDTYGITGSLLIDSTAVPEPASTALVGLGLAAIAFVRRRR